MRVRVHFYSYFKDLTGCSDAVLEVERGANVAAVLAQIWQRFPRLEPMRKSTLVAVGVEYQGGEYVLDEGQELSLFPPVQGG